MSYPSLPHDSESNPQLEMTVAAVYWDVVASIACRLLKVSSSQWGSQVAGGYNVVRFLHLDDENDTVVVVRVPYRPAEGWTVESSKDIARQLSSEVAAMRYVTSHTSIHVPHVIHYNVEADGGGVGSPYMMMTKVDGVALSSLWDDMEDSKRKIVLRQVVDILLELASQRFDKIGMLYQQDSNERAWYIAPIVPSLHDSIALQAVPPTTFTSGVDYWLAQANANLTSIRNTDFGHDTKIYEYGHAWFLRSLIPALYDPSLDTAGFPLCPGDFHSQNIMIVEADTSPRISGVIDWEFTGTQPTSSFAQYPLFIVDHPRWEDGHPLRQRNVQDQATFITLMRESESKKDPAGDLPLTRAFENSKGVYLFEQAIQFPGMFSEVYPQLFAYIHGDDEDFSTDYYWALMEHGILRKERREFERNAEVWSEALETLGSQIISRNMGRKEFCTIVQNHSEKFSEGGLVKNWLAVASSG
jgi:hypothetical protein